MPASLAVAAQSRQADVIIVCFEKNLCDDAAIVVGFNRLSQHLL